MSGSHNVAAEPVYSVLATRVMLSGCAEDSAGNL